ncbi:hypothetical protein CAOG_01610 [Capsaspora owczarzaki ATCC 30864]|uniref:J domain-containing protein n=1 Tax=Capsaspora owczarzaki (strain ATCC 30864) TaxID=595528 RepID=A0A0D2U539_CAPO3|nr:hypothetical protein CAOG_01610 [Capsaspora owczarzaki ATCC 30864]KJE90276.1 hypothetical protein CAOG_001610 [Capsaspora owczarzaki ATCC 30864]|eukprot:XP_004364478.1 hypothetical protein CAOG_01610 [Capsaspora owczarzaki ATCC 30864]
MEEIARVERCSPTDYYAILAVDQQTWTADSVRRQYIRLSRLVHPDKHGNSPSSTAAFQRVAAAYKAIGTEEGKRAYDAAQAAGTGPTWSNTTTVNAEELLAEVLRQMYKEFCEGELDNIMRMLDQVMALQPDLQLDRQSILTTLERSSKWVQSVQTMSASIKEEFLTFADAYGRFHALAYSDIFGRFDLALLCIRVVIGLPTKTAGTSFAIPERAVSLIISTQNAIDVGRTHIQNFSESWNRASVAEHLQNVALGTIRAIANLRSGRTSASLDSAVESAAAASSSEGDPAPTAPAVD